MAGFDGAEGADELLVRLQATAAGSTHSFRGRMEHTLFRLLGLMLEGRAKGQTASRRRAGVAWFSLALFLIDWLQLLSLVLSPKFGWPISFMNFLQAFSITSLLSLQSSTVSVFGTYLGVSLALQVVSLVLAAWGMYSVYSGFSGTLLPIKVLRTLVTVLLTAAFVPLMSIALVPLDCTSLRDAMQDIDVACWGGLHAGLFTAVVAVSTLFVAFALVMRAVFFKSRPNTSDPMARPLGRNQVMDTVLRLAVVLLVQFLHHKDPLLMSVLVTVLLGAMTLRSIQYPSFYSTHMMMLRTATYVALLWAALGAAILGSTRVTPGDDGHAFATYWVVSTLGAMGVGAAGIKVRLWCMRRVAVRAAVLRIEALGKQTGGDDESDRQSDTSLAPVGSDDIPQGGLAAADREGKVEGIGTRAAVAGMDMPPAMIGAPVQTVSDVGAQGVRAHETLGRPPPPPLEVLTAPAGSAPDVSTGSGDRHADPDRKSAAQEHVPISGPARPRRNSVLAAAAASYARTSDLIAAGTAAVTPAHPATSPIGMLDGMLQDDAALSDEEAVLDEPLENVVVPGSLEYFLQRWFVSELDMELLVRALMARPTKRSLMLARLLLDEALEIMPDSVFVRVTMAAYIFAFAPPSESIRAISLLATASQLEAPLDLRFAVLSESNELLKRHRALQLGAGAAHGMDSLRMIEFKKQLRAAEASMTEAIAGMGSFWNTMLSELRTGAMVEHGAETVGSLSRLLTQATMQADRAESTFLSMLEQFPTSSILLRGFGMFLVGVRYEEELGMQFIHASEERDADEERATSGAKSRSTPKSSHGPRLSQDGGARSTAGSSTTSASVITPEVVRQRRQALSHRSWKSRALVRGARGTLLMFSGLAALALVVFGISLNSVDAFIEDIEVTHLAGDRRKLVASTAYLARGMQLAALSGDEAWLEELRGEMEEQMWELYEAHNAIRVHLVADVHDVDHGAEITVRVYNAETVPPSLRPKDMVTWRAVNDLISRATELVTMPGVALRNASTSREWRFVMDNALQSVVPALNAWVDAWEEEDAKVAQALIDVLTGLLIGKVLVLLLALFTVFVPALASLSRGEDRFERMLQAVPMTVARTLSKRLRNLKHTLLKMHAKMITLDTVDPTSPFYHVLASGGVQKLRTGLGRVRRSNPTSCSVGAQDTQHRSEPYLESEYGSDDDDDDGASVAASETTAGDPPVPSSQAERQFAPGGADEGMEAKSATRRGGGVAAAAEMEGKGTQVDQTGVGIDSAEPEEGESSQDGSRSNGARSDHAVEEVVGVVNTRAGDTAGSQLSVGPSTTRGESLHGSGSGRPACCCSLCSDLWLLVSGDRHSGVRRTGWLVVAIIALLVGFQVMTFAVNSEAAHAVASSKSVGLNSASRRQLLVRGLFVSIRELLIGDEEMMPQAALVEHVEMQLHHMWSLTEMIEDSVSPGPEYALFFERSARSFSSANLSEVGALDGHGLQAVVHTFLDGAQDVLDGYKNTSAVVGANQTLLWGNARLRFLQELEHGPLWEELEEAAVLELEEQVGHHRTTEVLDISVLVAELVVIVAAYVFVRRRVITVLAREAEKPVLLRASIPADMARGRLKSVRF